MRESVKIVLFLLFWLVLAYSVDVNKVFHDPKDIFYVNPSMGEIKLKTAKGNISEVIVISDLQRVQMEIAYSEKNFEYFLADLNEFDTTLNYYFLLKDKEDSIKFPISGEFKPDVPIFITPEWATGKTYYTIFPDGFNNGTLANDPLNKLDWGKKPKNWRSYGGDLKGIIKKITYIDSLDPDIIILQPIFSAPSNHKLNPKTYAMLDPEFGDTLDLKNLINELHERGKKIILSIVITHTGTDFPTFTDIIEKSDSSKYINWHLVSSTPIKMSPPNYQCWRADPRFPKLNLSNTQVQKNLTAYLDYWKHFGFDGFYIGEDKTINSEYIKTLRVHLKLKYPDILLLGSVIQCPTGYDFDGCCDKSLTELLTKYFIKNTITTNDFDTSLRRLLFFKPSQANCTNLLCLSDYDTRILHIANDEIIRNLFAFIFTFCGSPVIMYGDEIGMSDCIPLNLGSFTWDPKKQNHDLLEEIKKLIQIRKSNQQISKKYFFTLYINDITKVYAYDRGGLIVVLNSGDTQSFVKLPAWNGLYLDLMSGDKFIVGSQILKLSVKPKSYRILRRET